jgi:hypothetical protein
MDRPTGLAYLSTPYSKYPYGKDSAFQSACILGARLLTEHGVITYGPIAHSHVLAMLGGIDPDDHGIWLPFDQPFLERCDCLIVAHMEGWLESVGMAHEMRFFENAGKPIWDLNPNDMRLTKR